MMAPPRSIVPRALRHPLRRFAQVDARRRWLVIEAAALLALARLGLMILPFRTLVRGIGTPGTGPRHAAASGPALQTVNDVGWAVTRAARYLPFRAVCLPQAIAARLMLRRRGIASTLHLGAAIMARRVEAHAWLDVDGAEVTGYPVPDAFAEIVFFV